MTASRLTVHVNAMARPVRIVCRTATDAEHTQVAEFQAIVAGLEMSHLLRDTDPARSTAITLVHEIAGGRQQRHHSTNGPEFSMAALDG